MNSDIQTRRASITTHFAVRFRKQPTVWSRAPGRVDLMGSHTDYNLGYVLTQAIDRDTWMAAHPRPDGRVVIESLNLEGRGEFQLSEIEYDAALPWTNYVRGVAAVLRDEGYPLRGFDGLIHSTIPFGSGLSSSAALEVATAVVFDLLSGLDIDPVEMALLCQRAENEFVGMNCGILDQYSSTMGRAGCVLLLDCRDLTSTTRPVAQGIQVVICDTRAPRALTGSEYAQRRAQCEEGVRILAGFYPHVQALRDVSLEQLEAHRASLSGVVYRRCRFVIEENQRVLDMAEALAAGDFERIGRLAAESYAGARDLYEISCQEMAWMMEAMISGPGGIGARQAGAGFGGCMVAFVEESEVGAFARHVEAHYQATSGIEPQVYPVQAAPGAGRLAQR
ncbi:MAG: galactokinase [Anaerolineae bacterium]|nr:galactokinase [Anaerolineae bacterium]